MNHFNSLNKTDMGIKVTMFKKQLHYINNQSQNNIHLNHVKSYCTLCTNLTM